MKKVVFWWNIPCAGMINVLKSYAQDVDKEAIVVTGKLSEFRKAMGWDDGGKLFENHIILSDDEWHEEGKKILDRYTDRIHLFNGISYPDRMRKLIDYAIENNIAFANMSEAYFNLEKGFRKLLKTIFMSIVLPYRIRRVSENSLGVMCLSGSSGRDLNQFRNFGFRMVFPFGYYTDEKSEFHYSQAGDGKLHVLCPGLIEHYKGVDILVKALAIVRDKGVQNFVCHITGKGSKQDYIKNLISQLGIEDRVKLEGVLDSKRYSTLLSQIDILVAPGRVEPWGIRINEAIQRGNVVVVSDGIGAHCLIKESEGGDVFKAGNPSDLADKLMPFLISQDTLDTAKKKNLEYRAKISCQAQAFRLHDIISQL
ncbi:D-inositol 3-phosphate glycosyltransferase [Muribaculaceae bacterium]|nr:D-inositol 3-phosphate glycosyltransferase [Muribaculaceae bacterium]